MRHRVHDRIFWFSCISIAFFLPVFGRIVPLWIVIMVLNWIIDGRFIYILPRLFREKERTYTLSFATLYILYLIGLTYTTNFDYGWFDLEIKLSMLVFPLVFATSKWPLFSQKIELVVLWTYIIGCLAGALLLLGHAAMGEFSENHTNSFYYVRLSWYFHPSYLSMYYNFAIGFLFLNLLNGFSKRRVISILQGGLIVFFAVMIFLLSSKAGILALGFVVILASCYAWKRLNSGIAGTLILGGGLILFIGSYLLAPVAFSRISDAGHTISSPPEQENLTPENKAERGALWANALEIIKKNFLFGVGTGDVKDILMDTYRKNGISYAVDHKLNAHNQYLQTFIAVGLGGFLVLVAMLLFPALRALRRHQDLYFVFLLIFAMAILSESMLEIQAGVVFYVFFNTFLFTANSNGDTVS